MKFLHIIYIHLPLIISFKFSSHLLFHLNFLIINYFYITTEYFSSSKDPEKKEKELFATFNQQSSVAEKFQLPAIT